MNLPHGSGQDQANLELQLDWDVGHLHGRWLTGPDNAFIINRLSVVPTEVTAAGAPRRVLEVAAAEAIHSCKLSARGIETFVVEPSPVMLERAGRRMAEYGARLGLIRGVGETLPFRDATFDRVLIESAIDHLAQPELSVGEMTRVLKPDGRLIITFVNYGGVSVRLSRLLYRAARAAGYAAPDERFFWDTPVPFDHTFECTYPLLRRLCAPHLELDRAFGVSMCWMVPGWGQLLARLPQQQALTLLRGLDRLAHRFPGTADVVVSLWRPRRSRIGAAPSAGARDPATTEPGERSGVGARDVLYASKARAEAEYWGRIRLGAEFCRASPARDAQVNEAYTGDPARSWIEDLIGRGPFGHAAVLGCDDGGYERDWLERAGSDRLDVYDLSPGVIRKVRAGLGLTWLARRRPRRRVRFIRADLNFAHLPEARYDVIWSSGCLHHIIDLEHLFAEVERALRPGGCFAFRDYVGERRLQFAAERLARINAVLRDVPARWRRVEAVVPPSFNELSPFCGVRSDDILPLATARFELVHAGRLGALFPLNLAVDLPAIERQAPEVLARLFAAEREALRDPNLRACGAYAVFRTPH